MNAFRGRRKSLPQPLTGVPRGQVQAHFSSSWRTLPPILTTRRRKVSSCIRPTPLQTSRSRNTSSSQYAAACINSLNWLAQNAQQLNLSARSALL